MAVTETFPNCTAALGHFNPYSNELHFIFLLIYISSIKFTYLDTGHGPREANITSRHVGDLGNLMTNGNGVININISDMIIQLYNSTQSILNRTIILHAMPDDGGNTGVDMSNTTGYDLIF